MGANILYLNQCISLGCYSEVDFCTSLKVAQHNSGFPLEFYFRGHKSPLALIQGDILGDFRGQSNDT